MNSRFRFSAAFSLWLWLTAMALPLWDSAQQSSGSAISQTFAERLAFGKSMYVENDHGSDIPVDVITSDLQGWGRFTILNSAENAELIAEVSSYESGTIGLGTTRSSSIPDAHSAGAGMHKDLSSPSVRLTVYEAKTKRELWSGTQKVKSAFKKKTEQDNVVAAAEQLFLRFHDAVEPPGKP